MIELKKVSKTIKNIKLFDEVTYKFEDGNAYLIKGPNGIGKSVLLKLIVGFSIPDSGEIIVDSKKLGHDFDFIPNAGISINNDEFIPYLNGYDNLKFLIQIKGLTSLDEINRYAEMFKINSIIKTVKYKNYSQGMKQKLRLIQALIEEPDILILDEPTNALDDESILVLLNLLKKFLEKKNRILVFVTHSDDVISTIANEVLYIKDFKIVDGKG